MRNILIVIRNPKAIEDEAAAVAIVMDTVVDTVHLAALAMDNRVMTAKHSVPYLAASHIAAKQWPTY